MKTMTTFAIAVALVAAWSVAPAMATTTTTTPPAVEQKDTVGDKVERAVDKTKEKAVELKDKVVDTTKKAKDKVVDTTKKAKDKVVDKTDEPIDKAAAKTEQMDVRHAQQSLKDKGFDPGPIDGIHGPLTSAALREYQTKEGLTVTGRLDDETMGRLNPSGTGTVRTGSEGTAPASPSASPATSPQLPAKQSR